MTDGDALRRAIVAEPDDDTPRLVYADWLDENGQPARATFVRAQIAAARAEPFGPQARAAQTTAAALEKEHGFAWTAPFRGFVLGQGFRRGFVEHIHADAIQFVENAARIFDTEPVQSLLVGRLPERYALDVVFGMEQLRRIRTLGFAPRFEWLHDDYEAFTNSPYLDALTDLAIASSPIDPPWFRSVLASEKLPVLAGLNLADVTNLGPALTEALVRADHRAIRRLDASRVYFTSDHLRRLLTCRCLRDVEELRLGWSGRAGDAGPLSHMDLGWVIPWGRLAVFDLAGQRLGDEGVKEIARNRDAVALRWLGLANNGLTAESVRQLVGAKHLKLYHLDVRGNGFSAAHLEVLRSRFPDALILG